MIEGLKIDVSTDELRKHLKERASEHGNKFHDYRHKLKAHREEVDALPDGFANSTQQSLGQQLKSAMDRHQDKEAYFNFVMEHLVDNEIYRLADSDLQKLEVIKGNMY